MQPTTLLSKRKIMVALFSCFIFITTCKKETHYVPNVFVDIYMYSTDPAFSPLNGVGGWIYLSGGSKGIIVYRNSLTEFTAYDRHCTYNVPDGNSISIDGSNLLAVDPVCGSKFLITDGSVNKSPATVMLKRYQTAFDGSVLHIFN